MITPYSPHWSPSFGLGLALIVASTLFANANIVLFQDDFSNGSEGSPVGINVPDPRGNPLTIWDNTSLSGSVLADIEAADDVAYIGHGNLTIEEKGGTVEWVNSTGFRGAFQLKVDLAGYIQDGGLTVGLDAMNPIVGGTGGSLNWFGWSLANSPGGIGGSLVKLNDGDVAIGGLLRENGQMNVFSEGSAIDTDVVYDGSPSDGTYDVQIDLTNITLTSFDYAIAVNGGPLAGLTGSVSLAGMDTSALYLSLETTTGASSLGQLTITTIPEPGTLSLIVLGVSALLVRRLRR